MHGCRQYAGLAPIRQSFKRKRRQKGRERGARPRSLPRIVVKPGYRLVVRLVDWFESAVVASLEVLVWVEVSLFRSPLERPVGVE